MQVAFGVVIGAYVGIAQGRYPWWIGGPGGYLAHAIGKWIGWQDWKDPKISEMPKLGEIAFSGASEGQPVPFCVGNETRVPGTYVYISALRTARGSPERFIGKGGGGDRPDAPVQTFYFKDVALVWSSTKDVYYAAVPVKRILANGRLIYLANHSSSQSSNQISIYQGSHTDEMALYCPYTGPSGFDFRKFAAGINITISGCSKAANNGTFLVKGVYYDPEWAETIMLIHNPAGQNEAAGANITCTQTWSSWQDEVIGIIKNYRSLAGHNLPSDDPLKDYYGDYPPGFGRRCFSSIGGLSLMQFSNQIPRMDAIIGPLSEGMSSCGYSDAIDIFCRRADFYDIDGTTAMFNTSLVNGTCNGYNTYGPGRVSEQIHPLMVAANVATQERNGVLYFFSRQNADEVTVDESDLGIVQENQQHQKKVEVNDHKDTRIPSTVAIEFVDMHNNYEKAVEVYAPDMNELIGYGTNKKKTADIMNISLGVAMSRPEAACIAKRLLGMARVGRLWVNATLPFNYIHILKNDKVILSAYDTSWKILVQERTRTPDYKIQIGGPVVYDSLLELEFEDTELDRALNMPPGPLQLFFAIVDASPLQDVDATSPCVYFAISRLNIGAPFRGAAIYESDDGATWHELVKVTEQSATGYLMSELPGCTAPEIIDNANTLEVEVASDDELESVTEAEMLSGANRMAIIDSDGTTEIIGYTTATLADRRYGCGTIYNLTGLWRGLCNTEESAIAGHDALSKIVFLNKPGLIKHPINIRMNGGTRYYKAVPVAGDPTDDDNYPPITHVHSVGSIRPYQVCHARAVRSATGGITLYWQPRTRGITRLFTAAKPRFEDEAYEIDVMDGETVVRTLTGTSTRTATYSLANLTADGFTAFESITFKFYQISPLIGRGKELEVTL